MSKNMIKDYTYIPIDDEDRINMIIEKVCEELYGETTETIE